MKSSSPMRAGRISAAAESPGSTPHHRQKPPRVPKENVDPGPDNVPTLHRSPSGGKPLSAKNRSPLPPRPPPPNPLKRKLYLDAAPTSDSAGSPIPSPADSGVQVILRIRPPNKEEEDEEDLIVQKISPEAVSILDHTFTFDSVTDAGSTQQDIFRLVGLPLVENCLAGFNSSIFAYGQTGSGKTYTMWGPTNVLSEDYLAKEERGLTPRVFEQLFARIKEEQIKHSGVQLSYQCRCSFLEIYNEQITDLLDLNQRNLQIREDTQTGVYVESLTEEYVSSTKDITKLLIKGLENRRTGATSLNIESSRSHCVFTCIVESRAKSMTDGLSSVRTSRINLVDLAGSERQKQTGAAGERLKEAGNINRSLSQLGNLINILAEISKSGKQRHIPYRDSRLTFLLQESLGGNAKLAMICAVSPSKSCKSETLSTLRFAKRAKSIKNKAVVNEVTHDDVNVLREQIRQLKDELLRMRSNGDSTGKTGSFSTGWNARRSLNIMRQSLCNVVDMEIDEEDAEKRPVQDSDKSAKAGPELDSSEETSSISSESRNSHQNLLPNSESTALIHSDQASNIESNMEVCEPEAVVIEEPGNCNRFDQEKVESELHCTEQPNSNRFSQEKAESELDITKLIDAHETTPPLSDGSLLLKALEELSNTTKRKSSSSTQSCGSIVPFQKSPAPEASPLKSSVGRKIPKTSSSMSTSRDARLVAKPSSSLVNKSSALDPGSKKTPNTPIMRKTVSSLEPTEHLALSLRRGLEVFELHQKKSPLGRSSFRFPLKPVEIINPSLAVVKVDCAVQTISQELDLSAESSAYVCRYCKSNIPALDDCKDANADNELQLVPVDTPLQTERPIKQVPKAVEKVLAGAIRREMALEDTCARQAAEIAHLHRLAQQYKHERECNVIIEQTREDKICRLEGLMDGIIPAEHYMEEEFMSLANEHKILREKYENHPDILRMNVELRAVQDELDRYRNFFDLGERDVLMEEIQDLRCQLQYYIDCSSSSQIQKRNLLLQLTRAHDSVKVLPNETSEHTEECSDKNFDDERQRWTETESRWISLSEELRQELETARSLTEKQKLELDSERKCSEELKEALQTAIQNHARMLEQYAELEEKHIQLLARHRKIRDGIVDVKKAAVRAGVKGSESRFIDCLGAEISTLKAEREKERRYWRDENKALRSQLNDTAEAVQAAGELLVRLKEAEEAAAMAQGRTEMAEKEVERALREITSLKQKHETEVFKLNQLLEESSRFPKEEALALSPHSEAGVAKYDDDGGETLTDEQWKSEFEPFCHEDRDFSRGAEDHSWFSDYDRCNI